MPYLSEAEFIVYSKEPIKWSPGPTWSQELEVNRDPNKGTNCANLLDLKPNLKATRLLKCEPPEIREYLPNTPDDSV